MGDNMPKRLTIQRRMLLHHLLIISLTVILLEVIFFFSLHQYFYKSTEDLLKNQATTSANFATKFMDLSPVTLQMKVSELLSEFSVDYAELQIVSPSGEIIASSTDLMPVGQIPSEQLKQAAPNRPTIYKGKNYSGERIMSSMIPLPFEDETMIYLRYNTSLSQIDSLYTKISIIMIAIGLAIILFVLIFSMLLAKKITKPLVEVTNASKQLAEGNFSTRMNENYMGELNTLAQSFNELSQALELHDKLKNQFISSVSHELRTPLTSIKGWGETILLGDLEDKDETKIGLNIICSETDRLIELVEELLDFSQLNHQTNPLVKTEENFSTIIEEVVIQFTNEISKQQVQIMSDFPHELYVMIDKNKMKQVLINLLDNALKYSEKNTTITLQASQDHPFLTFSIRDEGCGMSEEILSNITKPFVKVNEKSDGTGLGLSICQQIIKQHHGTIQIESKIDHGTKITWKIPTLLI